MTTIAEKVKQASSGVAAYHILREEFEAADGMGKIAVAHKIVDARSGEASVKINREFNDLFNSLRFGIGDKVTDLIKKYTGSDSNFLYGFIESFNEPYSIQAVNEINAKSALISQAAAFAAHNFLWEKYQDSDIEKITFALAGEYGAKQVESNYGSRKWFKKVQEFVNVAARQVKP